MKNDILKYLYDLVDKQYDIEDDNLEKEEKELGEKHPNAIWVGSDAKTSFIQKKEVLIKLLEFLEEINNVSHEIYKEELKCNLIDNFHYHFIYEKDMSQELIDEMTNWLKEKLDKILEVK